MLQNVINSIIDAEDKAEVIVKDATQQAKDNYMKAKTESEKMVKDNSKQLKAEYRGLLEEANKLADAEYDNIIESGEVSAKELLESSDQKINDAAKFVAGRLLEKYGNS